MDENKPLTILWAEDAIEDSLKIKEYLLYKFSQKEIDKFEELLVSFQDVVTIFPELYSLIDKKEKMRCAVMSKQLSIFYTY